MKRVMVIVAIVMVLTLALSATSASAWGGPAAYGGGNTYIVQRGDTLSGIAFMFGVHVFELARTNGIFNPNLIFVGQCLIIPAPRYGGGYGGGYPVGYGGYGCQQPCYEQCEQPCWNWNDCDYGCNWGGGYWGGYGKFGGGYNVGWGGYGCNTCYGGNYYGKMGFNPSSYTVERNLSTTFQRAKG